MSKIRVNEIVNQTNDGPVDFPLGLTQNGLPIEAEGQIEYTENGKFESNIDDWLVTGQGALAQDTIDPLIGVGSLEITNNYTDTRFAVSGTINTVDNFYISKGRPLAASFDYDLISTAAEGDYTYEIFDGSAAVPGTVVDLKPGFNSVYVTFIPKTGITYTHRIRDVDGTNGDTIKIDNVSCTPETRVVGMTAESPAKAGFIHSFAGSTAPDGWMFCQGQEVSQATYSELFANIGTTFNTATNPTTGSAWAAPGAGNFRLPDLRGIFARGVGTASGLDAVTLGGFQSDLTAVKGLAVGTTGSAHTHGTNNGSNSAGSSPLNRVAMGAGVVVTGPSITTSGSTHTHNLTGDAETRPRNLGLNYIIKLYDDKAVDMLTASRVQENARLIAYGSTTTMPSGPANIAFTNIDKGQLVSGYEYIIDSDGDYEISFSGQIDTGTLSDAQIQIKPVSGSYATADRKQNNNTPNLFAARTLQVGDAVKIIGERATGSAAFSTANFSVVRISDRSAESGLGYGLATSDTYGLVTGGKVPGQATSTAIAAGFIGERITGTMTNNPIASSGTVYNAGTIPLTAGIWMLYGKVAISPAGSTHAQTDIGISATSATIEEPRRTRDLSTSVSLNRYIVAEPAYVTISGSQTYYLVMTAAYTGTAPAAIATASEFYAVRIG